MFVSNIISQPGLSKPSQLGCRSYVHHRAETPHRFHPYQHYSLCWDVLGIYLSSFLPYTKKEFWWWKNMFEFNIPGHFTGDFHMEFQISLWSTCGARIIISYYLALGCAPQVLRRWQGGGWYSGQLILAGFMGRSMIKDENPYQKKSFSLSLCIIYIYIYIYICIDTHAYTLTYVYYML